MCATVSKGTTAATAALLYQTQADVRASALQEHAICLQPATKQVVAVKMARAGAYPDI